MTSIKKSKPSVGIDMVEVSRFSTLLKKKDDAFFRKVFSEYENIYCFAYQDKALHFAGIFAAKEAVSKALGVTKYPFVEIEIRHTKEGAPVAYRSGKKLSVTVSITHTKTVAAAVAIG